METAKKRPAVGFSVLIRNKARPHCLLVGRRLKQRGFRLLACPGGHLEFGESFRDAGRREVKEETGLDVEVVEVRPGIGEELFTTNWVEAGDHVVTFWLLADLPDPSQEPQNLEPDKQESWVWMPWDEICHHAEADPRQMEWLPVHRFAHFRSTIFSHGMMKPLRERYKNAQQAFDLYDFGPEVVTPVDAEWVREGDHLLSRKINITDKGGPARHHRWFRVRFDPLGTNVTEAYVV